MGIEEILTILGQFGFPAAVAVYALYQSYHQQERHEQRVDALVKDHKEEMSTTTTALNDLRVVIAELTETLRGGGNHGDFI